MHIKRLQLGLAAARLNTLGFIAIPALIDPAMAGPTDAQRTVLVNMDLDTALLLGIKTDSVPAEDPGAVRLDHGELLARYGGVYVDGFRQLSQILDLETARDFRPNVSDTSTVMFIFGKSTIKKLNLLSDDDAGKEDAIAVLAQGVSTPILMQFLESGEPINRSDVAAFYANELFDSPPMPMRNGHDTATASTSA